MNVVQIALAGMALAYLLAAAACGGESSEPARKGPSATGLDSLIAALRLTGLEVSVGQGTEHPFFSIEGTALLVGDASVHAFEYPDAASAEAEASRISPDGLKAEAPADDQTVATDVLWFATPHLYKQGGLIVLYVGDHTTITAALEDVLGPPLAGGY